MNLSGIAVIATPQTVEAVAARLTALPGVQVARIDRDGGRLVLVQEAASVADEVEGFRCIQRTPGVVSADLVCHFFGDQSVPEPDLAMVLARLNAEPHDDRIHSSDAPAAAAAPRPRGGAVIRSNEQRNESTSH